MRWCLFFVLACAWLALVLIDWQLLAGLAGAVAGAEVYHTLDKWRCPPRDEDT